MRSYASIKGHPIHPMLIVYPFAFLTGAFGFNLAAQASRRRDLAEVSQHLIPVGIAAGLTAAVPGVLDYVGSVPPDSSGRTRATKHALLNSAALGLFAASWLLGRSRRRTLLPLALLWIPKLIVDEITHPKFAAQPRSRHNRASWPKASP